MPVKLAPYSKFIVAAVGAVVVILTHALGADNTLVFAVETVAAALGVYATPNGDVAPPAG